jgi:putative oxidoreductase
MFDSIGLRPPRLMAYSAGASEAAGGALIALGLLTPLGAALLCAVMFTAIWTVLLPKGLWINQGGYEYNVVLIAAAFAITAIGAGDWSLDNVLGLDLNGVGFALASLAAGLLGAWAMIAAGHASFWQRHGRPHPVGR